MLGVNPRATHERTHRGECAPDLGAQEERDRDDGGDPSGQPGFRR